MDLLSYLRFLAALGLVLGLIGLIAWAVRRFGLAGRLPAARGKSRRLRMVEITAIDPKRRLVLVERDRTQHLLLLGPGGDLVIERDIAAPPPPEKAGRTAEPPASAGRASS